MEIVWKCSNYYLCFVHSSITTLFEIMVPYPFQYWFLCFPITFYIRTHFAYPSNLVVYPNNVRIYIPLLELLSSLNSTPFPIFNHVLHTWLVKELATKVCDDVY
jgi:hypothetical protein